MKHRWPELFDGYLVAVVLLVMAAVSLFGCTPPPTGGNNPVMVGDSILLGAQFDGALNIMPNAFINAQAGRGMYRPGILVNPDGSWRAGTSGTQAINEVEPRRTPLGWTVIELGTNDMDLPADYDYASIAEIMRQVPGCLAWVNVWNNANDLTRLRSYQFNTALENAERTRKDRCTFVIDWQRAVKGMEFTYLKDGVHTTPAGSRKLAELIKAVTG